MTTRAAIYARYSSDRQSEASAEDQARLCRDRADAEGWEVADVFADLALSGATRNRPGLSALLAAANAGEFSIVIAEALDRVSRDQEDIAAIWKQLRFAGVELVTLSEGVIGELHIGLKGTMAALFLKDLGEKTRRGQIGRVAAGRIPGGLSYGYAAVHTLSADGRIERGVRRIDEDQAAVIRRIFEEYGKGTSPGAIVAALNAEKLPSPSGGLWNCSTIVGNRKRRNGILHNELYAGRIVYNRQSFRRDPLTRKRVAIPNPQSEWRIQEAPELRIVSREAWSRVAARFARFEGVPAREQRRAARLFSGLVRCGECGGAFTIIGSNTWGCSQARQKRTCTNMRTIANAQLEARVLGAIREKLLAPDVIAAFVAEYHAEWTRNRKARTGDRARLERALTRAGAKVERLLTAIADGVGEYGDVRARLQQAAAERDAAARALEDLEAEAPIALHPQIGEAYRRNIAELTRMLDGPADRRPEAKAALRGLVERISATPRESERGLDLLVHGRLAQILRIAEGRPELDVRSGLLSVGAGAPSAEVVAGTGFEPVTFRL